MDSSENYTTIQMVECVNTAIDKWDTELNKAYKKLSDLLSPEQKEKLKLAQREWIIYRDKEIEFSNKLYADLKGTMWVIIAAQTKLDLIRKRTTELENYITDTSTEK